MANTSHHLQILRRARLVDAEKAGLYVTYRLADPQVGEFLLHLRVFAQSRLADIERVSRQYLEERGALEAVSNDELVRRVRAGETTLIDVRRAKSMWLDTSQGPSRCRSPISRSNSETCRRVATSWPTAADLTVSWRWTPSNFYADEGTARTAWRMASWSGTPAAGVSRQAPSVR